MAHYTAVHYITAHYTAVQYTPVHYTAVHYTAVHYTAVQYTAVQYTAAQYTAVQYATVHYTAVHYTAVKHLYCLSVSDIGCCQIHCMYTLYKARCLYTQFRQIAVSLYLTKCVEGSNKRSVIAYGVQLNQTPGSFCELAVRSHCHGSLWAGLSTPAHTRPYRSVPVLGPTQPHTQCTSRHFWGVKRPERRR